MLYISEVLSWSSSTLLPLVDDPTPELPPGTGPTQKFTGPWFSTQLILSLAIGLSSFTLFCFLRTRWDVVYMGRTKLKDFSPIPAHSQDNQAKIGSRFLGWIIPTWRTSEFTVLQTVGLDAAVLLNFYRMSFLLFGLSAILATIVLMPLNYIKHGSTDSEPDDPTNSTLPDTSYRGFGNGTLPSPGTPPSYPSLSDLVLDPQTSATINLLFTYLFTALTLTFIHRNFKRFIRARQSFALHLIHSISARTVLVENVPKHLRGDKALADYFEDCGWRVESVSVCREVGKVKAALETRTESLLNLESAWTEWVGNPVGPTVTGYDPNTYNETRGKAQRAMEQDLNRSLIPDIEEMNSREPSQTDLNGSSGGQLSPDDVEDPWTSGAKAIISNRPRPKYRPRWFGNQVDAIEYWEKQFRAADLIVRNLRRTGVFEATHAAFVTFEDVKSAQMACQVVHYPQHSKVVATPAPEPRDVVWSAVGKTQREERIRDIVVNGAMIILLSFWVAPVSFLASLLSYQEIKKVAPWLAGIIESSPRLAAIVQNSLPSLALISFNGVLPFLLSWFSFEQGYKSRSGAEYSLLRKYYLFLLVSVLFIFLLTTTYWALVRDLADSPKKIPEKLAAALQAANARNFMVSYVMLQALGLMPLQLLNLGPLFTLAYSRGFFAKTPRDYAEANAPPMLNYGWVYPQSILVFTVTLVYSVVSPLILVFGAIYFGGAYIVYKYKLLFIYFKPYESNGEAWLITYRRLIWALLLFQIFMFGLFSLNNLKSPYMALSLLPLILYTLWWSMTKMKDFEPLSQYLALSSICEVERGEGANQAAGIDLDSVPKSQSNLNHRRYHANDETLYVAPSSKHTDYSQPPLNNFYYGVLNTGRRRYAHPALTGKLPFPWLPSIARPRAFGDGARERRGVVLSLRRQMGKKFKRYSKAQKGDNVNDGSEEGGERGGSEGRRLIIDNWNNEGPDWGERSVSDSNDNDNNGGSGGSSSSNIRRSASTTPSNPWDDPTPQNSRLSKKISYDPGSGVIALPDEEENVWNDDSDEGDEGENDGGKPVSPSTYFHHPERRRTMSGSNVSSSTEITPNPHRSAQYGMI